MAQLMRGQHISWPAPVYCLDPAPGKVNINQIYWSITQIRCLIMNAQLHWNTEQVNKVLYKTGLWYRNISHVWTIQLIFMKLAIDHFQFLSLKMPKMWVCKFLRRKWHTLLVFILRFCIFQNCSFFLCGLQNSRIHFTVPFNFRNCRHVASKHIIWNVQSAQLQSVRHYCNVK